MEGVEVGEDEFDSVKNISFEYTLPPGCMFEGGGQVCITQALKQCVYNACMYSRFKVNMKDGAIGQQAYYVTAFAESSRMNVFVNARVYTDARLLSLVRYVGLVSCLFSVTMCDPIWKLIKLY